MTAHHDRNERSRTAAAIGVWENEGGAPGRHSKMDHQLGRRIESDRSWTVYHVFSGIPAQADGQDMIGLTRSDATKSMLALNLRNIERRDNRLLRLPSSHPTASETEACGA